MARPTASTRLVCSVMLGGVLLGGCGVIPRAETMSSPSIASADGERAPLANQAMQEVASEPQGAEASPTLQPQLVRTATLTLGVEDVETAIDAVVAIARQQQGELMGLQELPTASRQQVTLQIRVPQAKLEPTLEQLERLGQVQGRSLSATDVSTQQVDLQARLRNLRKTEEMLLTIMNRSGGMADVLKVAQELSNVRSTIEQLDAQARDLSTKVAFSTIQLTLEGAIAPGIPQRSATTQLQETWTSATTSLGTFTVNLLQLGMWLLVYSPYWLPLAIAAAWYFRGRATALTEEPNTDLN
jgi:Domain of unknown function (DUF4349)